MAFTVVQANVYDMENLPDYPVYPVTHGDLFATRESADEFAGALNATPAGAMWHHYSLTTTEAQAVLAEQPDYPYATR